MTRPDKISYPFVILLDLQMPRMNGLEFLEFLTKLRADSDYKNSVVFFLTTSEDEQDILNSYECNIAGYFIKDGAGEGFMNIANILDDYCNCPHKATALAYNNIHTPVTGDI
jgi:DNA-binding NarL/FixJ family response regulator